MNLFIIIEPVVILLLLLLLTFRIAPNNREGRLLKNIQTLFFALQMFISVSAFVFLHEATKSHLLEDEFDSIQCDTLIKDTTIVKEEIIVLPDGKKVDIKEELIVKTDESAIRTDTFEVVDKPIESDTFYVTLTTYNAVASQCDGNPLVTADGTKIDLVKLSKGEINYCAVSRDLLRYFKYGTRIYIDGLGVYEVHDTMNKRYSRYVDVLQDRKQPNFKKNNIKVYRVD